MQPLRSFGNHTFSEEAQQTIKSWINECDSNHPNCAGRADRGFIPTRLLDLNQHEDRVVLVDSRATNIRNQYTTLSYCWGRSRNLTLLAENIDQFMHEGVAISSLALTIQDAIKATRMLGVQYIWVDALCILQGSAGDFQFEVSLMLQVYRSSFVNLAASDSTDARDGIFRDRDGKRLFDAECQGRPNSKIFGNGIWRIVPRALWEEQILQAQLNTRGWVFQERLLSPRIIHFSRNQVFWDCATMSACENFPDGLPKPLDTGSNDRYWRWKLQDSSDLNVFLPTVVDSSLEQFWRNAVHNYSTCHLSFGVDKLVAIWGIVRFLIGALKERYADGMWERNLEEQLAWHVVGCQQGNGQPSTRQKGLDAPTWSWASIHGEIILPDRFAAVRDYQVVGHDGKEIAFDLIGAHKCSSHGPRTWAEQLKQYEARVEEIEELRMNGAQSSRTKPLEATDFSPMPRLRSPSIPIMGHIGKMILQKSPAVSVWTLTTFPIRGQGGYGVIEAFPDIQSDDAGHVLILILAMNLNSPEGDRGRKNQEFVKTYTGVGLMIDYNGPSESCNGHFVRKGAFQFNGTDFEVFRDTFIKNPKRHGITSDYDPEKGHKIWLD
ncbi:hypothetical protein SLS60_006427 [Paraconiothyrium brasiliense]|uniref:Heterokaryon incompatibility domain-containing protein n=1 Tax=Paraconiothyrium brasiliense TaxID=300254 RepID=A0ABR3RC52_9PLEO